MKPRTHICRTMRGKIRTARPVSAFAAAALACALACAGCKRENEGERPQTMNPASSQVMSNSAGMSGTPGQSDAAQRAQASSPAASAPDAASPASAVESTPPQAQVAPASGSK